MASVVLNEVSKSYGGDAFALSGIDLEIHSGEFIVLVGPSGCGKSTLLRLVAGLESLTRGRIEIGGRRIDGFPPSDRGIGMVFQDYALYPHMSVRENLEFGLRLRKLPREEISRRIHDASEMLRLSELLGRKPSQLSGGQRQRVAIGRALVKEPAVLLLDEPLSNLDAQLRAQTRLEIAALHRRIGSTTIYVTHDQEEAMTLADRIAVLEGGKLQQFAPPLTLYREPANRFVASFIGNPGMNFLEGELKRWGGQVSFELERERAMLPLPPIIAPARAGRWTLGFRPESWKLARGREPLAPRLTLRLERIESLGHEIQLAARLGSQLIRLRKSASESAAMGLREGTELEIELLSSELRWFDVA